MTLLTMRRPIEGPAYDKTKPETREAWLAFRRAGLTATEVRDWGLGSKRRDIIIAKVTGEFADLSGNVYINHGNLREPRIAAWIEGRFGIAPCDSVYSHPDEPRHLASPDGISLDPFSRELIVGTADAVLSEIKTSKHDLNPGMLDAERVLVSIAPGSKFEQSGYYVQMQWQMYVMQATRTLFVWEQHDGKIDQETGTFTPIGTPEYAWVPRDEAMIRRLVDDVAPRALAEIDAAMHGGGMPPVTALPAHVAILVADYEKALRDEQIAAAAKATAWKALQAEYLSDDEHERPDVKITAPGFATISKTTSTRQKTVVDEKAAREKAPALAAKWDALLDRYTTSEPVSSERLTITFPKNETEINS